MATFSATWVEVTSRSVATVGGHSTIMPVPDLSSAVRLTNLTTSGTSALVQSGGSDWESPGTGILIVFCDGSVNIAAGTAPTAAATAGVTLPAGSSREFTLTKGHKLAVVDV